MTEDQSLGPSIHMMLDHNQMLALVTGDLMSLFLTSKGSKQVHIYTYRQN